MRIGQRLVLAVARDRAVARLVADRGLKAAQASALVAAVADDKVQERMVQSGVLFDGSILSAIWQWVQTHSDLIEQIVQIIMTLVLAAMG